jgi:hypothetical protein
MIEDAHAEAIDRIVRSVNKQKAHRYVEGFADGMDAILTSLGEVLVMFSETGIPEREIVGLLERWREGVLDKTKDLVAEVEETIGDPP